MGENININNFPIQMHLTKQCTYRSILGFELTRLRMQRIIWGDIMKSYRECQLVAMNACQAIPIRFHISWKLWNLIIKHAYGSVKNAGLCNISKISVKSFCKHFVLTRRQTNNWIYHWIHVHHGWGTKSCRKLLGILFITW